MLNFNDGELNRLWFWQISARRASMKGRDQHINADVHMYLPWVWHLLNWEFNRLLSNKHKPPWKAWILIGPTGQSYLFYLQCISYFWWQGHRKEHRLGKTCWSFINETWANLPRGPIYLKLFMGTHSLSFPSSMKELQHLRTTECVFQCNEDLRRSEGDLEVQTSLPL